MIRSQVLIDKLVADLHFHNYLSVRESDNIFTSKSTRRDNLASLLGAAGLNLNPDTDFYHGGLVVRDETVTYVNKFIDDVFIDWFINSYDFKPIILPKGFNYTCSTPNGIVQVNDAISLDIKNTYDRCTFVNTMRRLLNGGGSSLSSVFPKNGFINHFYTVEELYGPHCVSYTLKSQLCFDKEFDEFLTAFYNGKRNASLPQIRGMEIKKYIEFIYERRFDHTVPFLMVLDNFRKGFYQIKDNHHFGDYSVLEVLFIYSLLINKFNLDEEAFLLSLCHCLEPDFSSSVLDGFIEFEKIHRDYSELEPLINQNDLYLRFASHYSSKAFTFKRLNEATDLIYLFNKPAVIFPREGNTLPLPFSNNLQNK